MVVMRLFFASVHRIMLVSHANKPGERRHGDPVARHEAVCESKGREQVRQAV
jgi:hypothetical protein